MPGKSSPVELKSSLAPSGLRPGGFIFYSAMNRTVFLIDGFNLYHSVKKASLDLGLEGTGTRWLDIDGLCRSYLHMIGNDAQVAGIYYFQPWQNTLNRSNQMSLHDTAYIECLKATNISVELSRFKKKPIFCPQCSQQIKRHEEKETDVALAAKLLEVFILDSCDTAVLVTGDTDIIPAVKTANRLFPDKIIAFLFLYKRHNRELAKLTTAHFEIRKEAYRRHQFNDPFITHKGKIIAKPSKW
ncbi:MAG: NYN domain-containing protein [Acidobacteria bacterium]|nr:NYN domain-containing protein [Acidobacteriota bacterium]